MGHDVEVEDQRDGFAEVVGHGQEGEVVGAEVEDEAGEVEGGFCGEEVEEGQDAQVGAGGLEIVSIVFGLAVGEQYLKSEELTSPPRKFSSAPNSAFACSTSHSAASKQSSGPFGNGCSGASRYPTDKTATSAPAAISISIGSWLPRVSD